MNTLLSNRFASILLLIGLLGSPAWPLSHFEGSLGDGSTTGLYDIYIRVYDNDQSSGSQRLRQTIHVPSVKVVDGRFSIAVAAGLEGLAHQELSIEVHFRPFEAWEPFKPARQWKLLPVEGIPEVAVNTAVPLFTGP